jgi:hypothetical protein
LNRDSVQTIGCAKRNDNRASDAEGASERARAAARASGSAMGEVVAIRPQKKQALLFPACARRTVHGAACPSQDRLNATITMEAKVQSQSADGAGDGPARSPFRILFAIKRAPVHLTALTRSAGMFQPPQLQMAPVRPPGRAYGFVRNKTHIKDNMKMKTLKSAVAFTLIAAFSSFSLMAGEMKEGDMKDGVMMKDGKMMVMKDGKSMAMDHTMTMSDGTKVTKTGKVMMPNHKKMQMKDGDMMMMDGKMMKEDKTMEKH